MQPCQKNRSRRRRGRRRSGVPPGSAAARPCCDERRDAQVALEYLGVALPEHRTPTLAHPHTRERDSVPQDHKSTRTVGNLMRGTAVTRLRAVSPLVITTISSFCSCLCFVLFLLFFYLFLNGPSFASSGDHWHSSSTQMDACRLN
jgi:hypothetical protein